MSDFLVIGSGVARLSFAIKAAQFGKVTAITKGKEPRVEHSLNAGRDLGDAAGGAP